MTRGFRPPGSLFFRRVLNHYGLRPQDIGPNSVLNISKFTVLCESYLQIPPLLPLFLELFHCKPQRECQDGPLLQCGGVSIQRRRQSIMPSLKLLSHTKDWQKTFFYCHDTSPDNEPELPGYSTEACVIRASQSAFAPKDVRAKLAPFLRKITVLTTHGLKGTDLIKTWMKWWIQPLSLRDKLFCDYTGSRTDPIRFTEDDLPQKELIKLIKTQLGETRAEIEEDGLRPFCIANPAPAVSRLSCISLCSCMFFLYVCTCCFETF